MHISLLGMGLFKLLKKIGLPVKVSCIVAAGFLVLYGIVIGFSPSAVRAIIMFLIHMLAKLLQRTYDMLTAVAVAAVLILLEQPLYLYHSGFVFSFSCMLGIGLFLPVMSTGFMEKKISGFIQLLTGGMVMAIITLPVYLWFYYQFPIYSVFLNFFIIPLMTFLMTAGLMLLMLECLIPLAGLPFILFICGVLKLYSAACVWTESLPGHLYTPGRPQMWQLICYLSVLLLLIVLRKKLRLWVKWAIICLAVPILIIRPQNSLEMTFLDVGQGDCIFIQNEEKEYYLIDGGSSSVSDVGEYRILPFLKYKGADTLEAVFVTHADADHCNGILELLETGKQQGIRVKNLILPKVDEQTRNTAYKKLLQTAAADNINILLISRGERLLSGKLTMTCMHPASGYQTENANEYSIVLLVEYGEFSALLTGDVEANGEEQMEKYLQKKLSEHRETEVKNNEGMRKEEKMKQGEVVKQDEGVKQNEVVKQDEGVKQNEGQSRRLRRLTILKAAHHGSRNSTSSDLLTALQPFYTVISCGEDNVYGHPHEELLDRLANIDTKCLRTDECGAITIETDGIQVWLSSFR